MMIRNTIIRLLLCWMGLLVLHAQAALARELCGDIVIQREQGTHIPAKNVIVWIKEFGNGSIRSKRGTFCFSLPDFFKPGEFVTLAVDYKDHKIVSPAGGRVLIPADLRHDRVRIVMDELGSRRFLEHEVFALLMETIAREAKEQVVDEDQYPQEIDLDRYLKNWATQLGFRLYNVQAALDEWATELEANNEDLYELGLAAFYHKNFSEAAHMFTESARYNELRDGAIRDYRLAGDVYYLDYRFRDALSSYQNALRETYKTAEPQHWTALHNNLAETRYILKYHSKAGECYGNVLQTDPAYHRNYQRARCLYHEHLFLFEDAYALDAVWVGELGNDDLSSASNFAETRVTTARFAEAEELFFWLLPQLASTPELDISVRAIEILNLLAQNKTLAIPDRLDALIKIIQQQPEDFRIHRTFNGLKHFLSTSEAPGRSRDWLRALFTALEADHRDVILQELFYLQEEL